MVAFVHLNFKAFSWRIEADENCFVLGNRTGHFARECRNNFGGGRGFGGTHFICLSLVLFRFAVDDFGVRAQHDLYRVFTEINLLLSSLIIYSVRYRSEVLQM